MAANALHIDIEVFSEADLPRVGVHRYARDPSTRVLCIAWALGDAAVQVVDLHHGEALPQRLVDALADGRVEKWAHNAQFERAVLSQAWIDPGPASAWRCTMVGAMSLGLPGGLDDAARELGLQQRKDSAGKKLIRALCTPALGGPDAPANAPLWPYLLAYCRQDVEVERALHAAMADRLQRTLPPREWRLWAMDQAVNDRGWPVDLTFVAAAVRMADDNAARCEAEAKELSGVANTNSRPQLLRWLSEQGVDPLDLRAGTVAELLRRDDLPADVRRLLELRQELSATSVAKFEALQRATCDDGRLRGTLQFFGARTGRWSGRLFQPQNLPRGSLSHAEVPMARKLVQVGDLETVRACWPSVSGVLSSLVRPALRAPKGRKLVVADLASIESVMLAWAAGSEYLLQLFRDGRDPYKDFAARLFHIDYAAVSKAQRTLAKPATLGCFAADTLVLTDSGWLPIVKVQRHNRLWDGVEWVAHDGVVDQGVKLAIDLCGVRVTPDHPILCEDGTWKPAATLAANTHYLESAAALARSRLPATTSEPSRTVRDTAWFVTAAQNLARRLTTFAPGAQRVAALARAKYRRSATRSGRVFFRIGKCVEHGSTAIARWFRVAQTPRRPSIATTADAAFTSALNGRPTAGRSLPGSHNSPGTPIWRWSWIASTTPVRTARAIAAWLRERSKPETSAGCIGWSTRANAWYSRIFTNASRQRTSASHLSAGKFKPGTALTTSSAINRGAEVRTFDIANAGPRHRFTIWTEAGPLVAHNCGYGLGSTGLQAYAAAFGVTLSERDAQQQVALFRSAYPDIPRFWYALQDAAMSAIQDRTTRNVGRFAFDYSDGWLMLSLPSGRALAYPQAHIRQGRFGAEIAYTAREGKRLVIGTHPGKLTENIVQAIARDVLCHGIMLAERAGLTVVGHVHDEIVCEADEHDDTALPRLLQCMGSAPAWCSDAPIRAAGWEGEFYGKD